MKNNITEIMPSVTIRAEFEAGFDRMNSCTVKSNDNIES